MVDARRSPVLVLLAAGASRRLGTCKALVNLREEHPATPLDMLLAAGADFDSRPPRCVTGRHHAEIAAAAPGGLELLENPGWERGRTGSIQRAVRRLAGEDLCLAPVDVPTVPRRVFSALLEAWRAAGHPPRGWLAPRVGSPPAGRHGHPVVLGHALLARLLEDWAEDRPLRELRSLATPLLEVETDSDSVLCDLDSPVDLAGLRQRLATGEFA